MLNPSGVRRHIGIVKIHHIASWFNNFLSNFTTFGFLLNKDMPNNAKRKVWVVEIGYPSVVVISVIAIAVNCALNAAEYVYDTSLVPSFFVMLSPDMYMATPMARAHT